MELLKGTYYVERLLLSRQVVEDQVDKDMVRVTVMGTGTGTEVLIQKDEEANTVQTKRKKHIIKKNNFLKLSQISMKIAQRKQKGDSVFYGL